MIGKTFSHYEIIEELGRGGMGVVYKAQDSNLNRLVALKFLPQNLAASREEISRFHQEANAISALNHPNIATIYDFEEGEEKFLVLEYIPGGTLKSKIKQLQVGNNQMPIPEVLEIGIQIAEGLAHAHKHQIVHRDVKPENIMFSEQGNAKLMDFGLAKLKGSLHLTKTGSTLGTAAYMSPEQVRGEDVDSKTDIFSLGVLLYEIATAHRPFSGEYEAALSYSIVHDKHKPVRSLRSELPQSLESVIDRCLQKEKSDRPEAHEAAGELKKIRKEMTGEVRTIVRKPKLPWLIAAAAILLGAAGVFLFYPRSSSNNLKTIAVLPFENMSGNPEDEYFSDGITEDILTELSKIGDLNVISRTTVMQYKGTDKSLKAIGRELGAGVILEGSVRRAENQIRITGQLIDARTDKHLWADAYDREMKDIFSIQSDVAEKIAVALKAKLSPEEKERIGRKPTENMDAYGYWLKAREYYYRYTKGDNEIAIGLLKKAIRLDPNYAQVWADLGGTYAQKVGAYDFPMAWLDSSMAASNRAIELDKNSADAYKALAMAHYYKGQMDKSFEANLKAVELNPNHFAVVGNLGISYLSIGDLEKAFVWLKKAVVIAPTYGPVHISLGELYRQAANPAKAEQYLMKGLDLLPNDIEGSLYLSYLRILQGKNPEAMDLMESMIGANLGNSYALEMAGRIADLAGDMASAKKYYEEAVRINPSYEESAYSIGGIGLGSILWKEGRQGEAERLLKRVARIQEQEIAGGNVRYEPHFVLARVKAIEGKKDEACTWLQKAIDLGWRDYTIVLKDPWFENLYGYDRFESLMAQLKVRMEEMYGRIRRLERREG